MRNMTIGDAMVMANVNDVDLGIKSVLSRLSITERLNHKYFNNLKEAVDKARNSGNIERTNMLNRYNVPKEYQTNKNKVWDEKLRDILKDMLIKIGGDMDGDLVYYEGQEYFVDMSQDIVEYINWIPW